MQIVRSATSNRLSLRSARVLNGARVFAGTGLAASLVLLVAAASPAQGADCPALPPVASVGGITFYVDKQGSVTDKALEEANLAGLKPIGDFLSYVEAAVDPDPPKGQPHTDLACAAAAFQHWAEAKALAGKPTSTQGANNRSGTILALTLVGLKLRGAGVPIGAAEIAWLRDLAQQEIAGREANRLRNNIYFNAGVIAATFALLSPEPFALAEEDRVWRTAMTVIADDGSIADETARGHRALIYHQNALSALLLLRQARIALGQPPTAAETAGLKRLAHFVGAGLCDPKLVEQKAGVSQEMPGHWGFRIGAVFGTDLMDADWTRCGMVPPAGDYNVVGSGGDLHATFKVLSDIHQHHGT